jgi:glycosyltransferase involved in cell wall biosynthesis
MNHIIRSSRCTYEDLCNFLIKNFEFKDCCLSEKTKSLPSKVDILVYQIKAFLLLLYNRKRFHSSNVIISIGYFTLSLMLFTRLHLLKFRRIYWVGFFLHNPRYLVIFKLLLKVLSNDKLHFIVFSKHEKGLYSRSLGIRSSNLHYFPYGDFRKVSESNSPNGDTSNTNPFKNHYYFSGGYSNRDYKSLIKVFSEINKNLVIVCSKNNKDVFNNKVPDNIKIYKDLSSVHFDYYLNNSLAVVLPFKHNCGASGQSVMLRCMRNKKAVIATKTETIKEYIEDGISGLIINDLITELPDKIQYLEDNKNIRDVLGKNLFIKYTNEFSYEAITPYLEKIVTES